MKFYAGVIILVALALNCSTQNNFTQKRDQLFDNDWHFYHGHIADAENPEFDDSAWRVLDLPHDWSIEDLSENPRGDQVGPFSKDSPGSGSTGFTIGGTGWYRKTFTLDAADSSKSVTICFDGVYMESTVWLNGHKLGYHPYGYTPFVYDLTPLLNPAGTENVLAVQVKNVGKNSRWYSGSGIYRHVTLAMTDPVHVAPWGVYVTTPEVSFNQANIHIQSNLLNDSENEKNIKCETVILNPRGKAVAHTESDLKIAAGNKADVQQQLLVHSPELWSLENPALYQAQVTVVIDDEIVDQTLTTFGIRSIEFSPEKGFLLNGETVLLKGGNVHHDNGPLGSATFDRAEERRVELLKKNGFNAIRTSHNLPSKPFLDACDRLGMLVLDEAFDHWQIPKNPNDYNRFFDAWHERDLTAMLLRDRNHPSIILWSIGNEINERAMPQGIEIARELVSIVKRYDQTRPVTNAICGFWEPQNKGREWADTAPAFAVLDVHGYNYQWQMYEDDFAQYPNRIICGTESFPLEAFENWQMVEKLPYVIGDFVWTGMDYFGEAAIGRAVYQENKDEEFEYWPWFNGFCGDIDVCGFKKPQSYYRDVVWGNSDLEVLVHEPVPQGMFENVSRWGWPNEFPSWTWPNKDENMQVRVFSKFPTVQLLLNGKLLGTRDISPDSNLTAVFSVPYVAGTLEAVALQNGQEKVRKTLVTAGEPVALRLVPDRAKITASRNDLAFITVEVVDAENHRVPNAVLSVQFTISGAGELAAVANGNPKDMKSFQTPKCDTFHGRCLLIVRSTGKPGDIRVSAKADGFELASAVVAAK